MKTKFQNCILKHLNEQLAISVTNISVSLIKVDISVWDQAV